MKNGNAILLASMQEIQRQVDVLHTISMVCLVIAIVLLIAAIVEFFLLDILKIILIKTGRAAKMGIRELEAENAGSGRLKSRAGKGHNMWNTSAPLEPPMGSAEGQAADAANFTASEQNGGSEGTALLENAGSENTTLLEGLGSNETTLLEQQAQYDYSNANITMPLPEEPPVKIGRFLIVRNIMMIHTDEVI